MKTKILLSVFIIVVCANACQRKLPATATTNNTTPPEVVAPGPPDAALIKANNEFALELYRQIKSDKDNIFFSPYSISTALAMTYAGARGESEKQMAEVMHFGSNQSSFHSRYRNYLSYINGLNAGDSVEINTAQAMFAQKEYEFLDSYFNLVKSNYNAGLQLVDFKNELEKSRVLINTWVAGQTKNRIENLIAQGMITDLARLVLVNAIYFKASWAKAFNPAETITKNFFPSPESPVKADFMKMEDIFSYREDSSIQLIEIPYCDSTLSMLIFLPKDKAAMSKIETLLRLESTYSYWLTELVPTKVRLLLPKFKLTSEFELSDVLKKMGMPHPFSSQADFSGITGKMDLMIDKVIHKAFVEVSEQGTEAAASTAVIIRQKSAMVIPEFNANRPFIFIIKDNTYNNILFMGRVNKL